MARPIRGAPRPLLALHSYQAFLERLRRAAHPSFALRVVASWSELRDAALAAPTPLVVVDPFAGNAAGDGTATVRDLQSFLTASPAATVIAAVSGRRQDVHDLWALARSGVAAVISIDDDVTPEAIRRRLHWVRERSFGEVLDQAAAGGLEGRGRQLVVAAAEVVQSSGDARDLARATHASVRTLERWCAEARLPPPRRLLRWARVLLAARLLDDPRRSAESVAESCGYGSKQALYRAMRQATNTSPGRAGAHRTFNAAVRAFVADLERLRSP